MCTWCVHIHVAVTFSYIYTYIYIHYVISVNYHSCPCIHCMNPSLKTKHTIKNRYIMILFLNSVTNMKTNVSLRVSQLINLCQLCIKTILEPNPSNNPLHVAVCFNCGFVGVRILKQCIILLQKH